LVGMTGRRFYEFGSFTIDEENHVLLREGEPVKLTPKAYELLLLFVQNSGPMRKRTLAHRSITHGLTPFRLVSIFSVKQKRANYSRSTPDKRQVIDGETSRRAYINSE
jgi:DNA-binding response OmpR family regulator